MRDILIIGVIVAVVIILIRVILKTPLMREAFTDSSPTIKSQTECPKGAQMYMYNGASYCCSGTVNADARHAKDSCRPLNGRNDTNITFCTLGPSDDGVRNCQEMRSDLLRDEGASICPPNMPTFVKGETGRCCADDGNADHTACTGKQYCDVATDPNFFKQPNSCQFLKAQSDDGKCPQKFNPFTTAGQNGFTLYGCTDGGQNCYPDATLKRLTELGYDIAGLPSCSKLR